MTSGPASSPAVIGGRYRVQRSLASGSMGQVLVAWDQVLERQVAVKTLLPERCESPRAQLRFVDEAHINAQLQHPGIVAAHELGRHGNELYLVMRLVEGEDMAQLVRRLREGSDEDRKAWPLARRLRLCLDLCETLAFAHDQGVIHRDLKPANVLLEHGSEVVVSDWGLAKVLGDSAFADAAAPEIGLGRLAGAGSSDEGSSADLTVEGRVVGTPIYMAPEQARGRRDLDRRADVYSLGAILYELITLVSPYSGRTQVVLQSKIDRPPPKPSWVVDCPPALDAIATHAMAPDRMLRYRDASELANDVAAFLDGRSVSSHHETLVEGLERLSRRHRTAVRTAVAAMVMLAILAVAAGTWLRHERLNVAAQAEDHESATRLAATASQTAGHAKRQAEASAAVATRTSELLTRIANLELLARRATPINLLVSTHTSARRELVDELKPSPLTAAPPPLEPLAIQREALGALGRSLDLVLARALVRRAPRRALELLDDLDLGAEAPLLRARALLRLRRTPEALALLAQRASPSPSPALAALAAQYQPLPAEERVAAFDRAIEAQPRGWLYTRRAECRVAAGDLEGAWADYDLAARLEPTDPFIYISRLRNATFPYASFIVIDAWESLVGQLTDDVGDLPTIAGRLYLWKGRIDLSRFSAIIKKAVEEDQLSQQEGDARLSRGALIVNQLDKAEHHARSALSRPGDQRLAMGYLAEVALRRGRWGEAQQLAREGLSRFSRHPRLRFVLGEALRRLGRPAEALDHLRAGARPSLDPVRWERLARCLAQLDDPGGWQEGLQAAHRALSMDAFGDRDGNPDAYPEAGTPIYNRTLSKLHHRRAETGLAILHSVRALVCAEWLASRRGVDLQDALDLGVLHEGLGLVAEARLFYDDARADPRVKTKAEAHLDRLRPR